MSSTAGILAALVVALPFAAPQEGGATHPLGADGHERRPAHDILEYAVEVDLRGGALAVRTIVEFAATAPFAELVLDYRGPKVTGVWSLALTASSALPAPLAPGAPLPFEWRDGRLTIRPAPRPGATALQPGEPYALLIATEGWPAVGVFRTKNRQGESFVFTDAWPSDTRFWMPCEDHPSDKARFACTLRLPEAWRGVANGARGTPTRFPAAASDGRGVTEAWRSDAPIYTALMAFAAGPFQVVSDEVELDDPGRAPRRVPLEWWLYAADADAGLRDCAIHAEALRWLDTTVGAYPYAKYAVVQIPTQYGGVENASNTFLRDAAIDGTGANASTLVHELCHQWFGDSVTEEDWHDLWLSEGFATYFAAVTMDAIGREPLAAAMAEMRTTILAAPEVKLRPIRGTGPVDPKQRLDANSYPKGAWFLHMLRTEVGDAAFFRAIRRWYADHRDGNASSDDLRRAMEAESSRDLAPFFTRGLERAGFPIVRGDLSVRDGRLVAHWSQHDAAAGEREPCPLRFQIALGRREAGGFTELARETVAFTAAESDASFALPPGLSPAELAVRADPDVVVLARFELRGIPVAE